MREFRIKDVLSPSRLLYWRWKLWKSQYDPPDRLKELQWKLLSRLLDHCFKHVPFYENAAGRLGIKRSDFQSLDDLSCLPVIDKFTVLGHREELMADNFDRFRPREMFTSGTTGTPVGFFWDVGSTVLELVSQWRHFSWSGYRLGDAVLDIRSMALRIEADHRWNRKCRGLELSSDLMDSSNVARFAALVKERRIKLWRGYPSAISHFIRLLVSAGIDDIKPRAVITVAESLLDSQRRLIESWTGVPVCDNYGQIEHAALVCQCPEGGYHICSEYGIVEILKEDGTPAGPGEEGRLIATNLHNRVLPLLRYDTGDYAVASESPCRCGRTLPLVAGLVGRTDDRLLRPDGKWVSGLRFSFCLDRGTRIAQIVQQDRSGVDVYVVPTPEWGNETEESIRRELKLRLGESMDIRVHAVAEVPFGRRGKYKFVVNRLGSPDPG
jgi:phenylacetate-CoA ligase